MEAKFLTYFSMPTKFIGYPCSLAILIDTSMAGKQMYFREKFLDINRNLVGIRSSVITDADRDGMAFFNIQDDVPICCRYIECSVVNAFAAIDGFCYGDPPTLEDLGDWDPNDFDPNDWFATPDSPGDAEDIFYYSERKLVYVETDCFVNNLFLKWTNPLGAKDGWLFTGDKDYSHDTIESFSRLSLDYRQEIDVYRKGVDRLLVRTGGLTKTQANELKTSFTSTELQTVDAEGLHKRVKMTSNSFGIHSDTDNIFVAEVELQLEFQNALIG